MLRLPLSPLSRVIVSGLLFGSCFGAAAATVANAHRADPPRPSTSVTSTTCRVVCP